MTIVKNQPIFVLSLECVQGAYLEDAFLRVIEVSSAMSLSELHLLIQDLIGFSDEHLTECFIATRLRGKKIRLMTAKEPIHSENAPEMKMPLVDIFQAGTRKKLFYTFDFGDHWIFEIRKKTESEIAIPAAAYPRILQTEGVKPI